MYALPVSAFTGSGKVSGVEPAPLSAAGRAYVQSFSGKLGCLPEKLRETRSCKWGVRYSFSFDWLQRSKGRPPASLLAWALLQQFLHYC
eukprot:jgi/Chlat1/1689/Chrsp127S01959